MARPILAVDVDGVIVLFGDEGLETPAPVQTALIDGMMHRVSLAAGPRLRRLSEDFELIWASGWEERANEHLPALLGIPELPHIGFGRSARFGSADWKIKPLDAFSGGRALAWIDDSFDDSCHRWASERAAPTRLVSVESHRGLEEDHVEVLSAWARTLD